MSKLNFFIKQLPGDFKEIIKGNDMCPSIVSNELDLQIYIDAEQPEDREDRELERFTVARASLYGEISSHIISTEHWPEVIDKVKEVQDYLLTIDNHSSFQM